MYPHWRYFETLDQDLRRLSRFVEVSPPNFGTFSIEMVRILLAACSEIDVVAKRMYFSDVQQPNIDHHRQGVLAIHPNLPSLVVTVPSHGILLNPWSEWNDGLNPPWWREHNEVKHNRELNFAKANLGNCLNAIAGLMVLVAYLYKSDWQDLKIGGEPRFLEFIRPYEMIHIANAPHPLP